MLSSDTMEAFERMKQEMMKTPPASPSKKPVRSSVSPLQRIVNEVNKKRTAGRYPWVSQTVDQKVSKVLSIKEDELQVLKYIIRNCEGAVVERLKQKLDRLDF